MDHDPQTTALTFLTDEHQLSPDEAAQALQVARTVLGEGLARLRRAVTASDAPVIQEMAHTLKGSLLNLGLTDLAGLAQELERSALNRDEAGQERLTDTLARALASFADS